VRDRNALTELLKRARLRHFAALLIDQASFSLALAMGAAIVLLLAGTEILAWYWLAVVFGGGLAVGVWRTIRRFPSSYALAQSLDRRLSLHDALSTALHFRENPGHADPGIREEQRRRAEELAGVADLRRALPFGAPRSIYWTASLTLAAGSLFGLRYGVTRTLDVQHGLVKIAFDNFFQPSMRVAQARKSALQKKIEEEMKKIGINVDSPDSAKAPDAAPDSVLNVVDEPNVDSTDSEASKTKPGGKPSQQSANDPEPASENPENAAAASQQNANDSSPSKDGASQNDRQAASNVSKQSPNGGGDSNSLIDKMRDAMANLMSKMKMQPPSGESRQSASNAQNGNLQSGGSQQMGKKGAENSGRQSSDGADSSEQQGNQQQAQDGQNSQAAQGKSGDRNAERPVSQDAKSGIGRQDGDKTAREAADLAAMGKISEIIGKRSANLTGDVMVEVPSGKQQLKTPYAQRSATHVEAGGEINRDEVPLIYQQYVEQYFEQIRKEPESSPSLSKGTAGEPPFPRKATKAEE